MTVYKLTNEKMQTRNGFQWELGVPRAATGAGAKLCTNAVLHYYRNPIEAVLYNPIHAGLKNPLLFEAEADGETATDGLKGGCKTLTLLRRLELPEVPTEKRIEFAIRCAKQVYSENEEFVQWANRWLDGTDRTARAARAAHHDVHAAHVDANAIYASNVGSVSDVAGYRAAAYIVVNASNAAAYAAHAAAFVSAPNTAAFVVTPNAAACAVAYAVRAAAKAAGRRVIEVALRETFGYQ